MITISGVACRDDSGLLAPIGSWIIPRRIPVHLNEDSGRRVAYARVLERPSGVLVAMFGIPLRRLAECRDYPKLAVVLARAGLVHQLVAISMVTANRDPNILGWTATVDEWELAVRRGRL